MDMSFVSNLVCVLMMVVAYFCPDPIKDPLMGMGSFGFSGAITNWLAIHMLFERVPGLYGSGIIPLKFEAFKAAIRSMIMDQFFTRANIEKFTNESEGFKPNLQPVIEHLDYNPIFDGFVEVVMKSKFGGMLGMFGGMAAIEPMREPFIEKLKEKLQSMTAEPDFLEHLTHNAGHDLYEVWHEKIAAMVDHRLSELTPPMVKDIIQEMIRSHLGWLVVWGAVFGALIGLVTSFLN